jgi:hypothetical protein
MKNIELENGEEVTPRFFKVLQSKPPMWMIRKFTGMLRAFDFKLMTRKAVLDQMWEPEPHANVKIWIDRSGVVELHSDGSWLASFSATSGRTVKSLERKLVAAKRNAERGRGFHADVEYGDRKSFNE